MKCLQRITSSKLRALLLSGMLVAACLSGFLFVFQQPDVAIFILAGQSNMSGRGKTPVPAEIEAAAKGVLNYTNAGHWEPAREPLDDATGQVDTVSADASASVGPGLAFAARMLSLLPGQRIGLMQCAKGASPMAMWIPGGGRDTLYGSCIARAREAQGKGHIAGILWYQGESDAASEEAARSWGGNFTKLVAAFRHDLADPTLPVVYAQIGNVSQQRLAKLDFAQWALVKEAQAAVSIPRAVMIAADKYEISDDGIHLTTSSYMKIGEEFAETMFKTMQAK